MSEELEKEIATLDKKDQKKLKELVEKDAKSCQEANRTVELDNSPAGRLPW